MRVLSWFIPKFLIKKNSIWSFLIKGFVEKTSPRELGRATRVRWFQKKKEKVLFFEGELKIHKNGVGLEGIVIRYGYNENI